MRSEFALLPIIAAVLPVMMFGQESVKPVTVCEVLANPKNFEMDYSRLPVLKGVGQACPAWSATSFAVAV
jgi:hypothetical protein